MAGERDRGRKEKKTQGGGRKGADLKKRIGGIDRNHIIYERIISDISWIVEFMAYL